VRHLPSQFIGFRFAVRDLAQFATARLRAPLAIVPSIRLDAGHDPIAAVGRGAAIGRAESHRTRGLVVISKRQRTQGVGTKPARRRAVNGAIRKAARLIASVTRTANTAASICGRLRTKCASAGGTASAGWGGAKNPAFGLASRLITKI
jgi:hypothetical protein